MNFDPYIYKCLIISICSVIFLILYILTLNKDKNHIQDIDNEIKSDPIATESHSLEQKESEHVEPILETEAEVENKPEIESDPIVTESNSLEQKKSEVVEPTVETEIEDKTELDPVLENEDSIESITPEDDIPEIEKITENKKE